jgi:hypothetical protein
VAHPHKDHRAKGKALENRGDMAQEYSQLKIEYFFYIILSFGYPFPKRYCTKRELLLLFFLLQQEIHFFRTSKREDINDPTNEMETHNIQTTNTFHGCTE